MAVEVHSYADRSGTASSDSDSAARSWSTGADDAVIRVARRGDRPRGRSGRDGDRRSGGANKGVASALVGVLMLGVAALFWPAIDARMTADAAIETAGEDATRPASDEGAALPADATAGAARETATETETAAAAQPAAASDVGSGDDVAAASGEGATRQTVDIDAAMAAASRRIALLPFADPEHARSSPPWRRYAAESPVDFAGKRMLAVIIDDVAAGDAVFDGLLALDAPIALSIFPNAEDGGALAERVRAAGKEALLHVPMTPVGGADPGPNPISADVSSAENERRIRAHLAAFDGYVGVNNHMGSAATADIDAMRAVMRVLAEDGYLFIDSRTSPESRAAAIAGSLGVPVAASGRFLDNVRDATEIRAQLREAERQAERYGSAVVIGHAHPEMLAALQVWLAERRDDPVALAPVSTVVKRRMLGRR